MNVPIYLKDGLKVSQPMAEKPWKFGTLIGATVGGDERPYAIVLTEHQEFELVHWYQIECAALSDLPEADKEKS